MQTARVCRQIEILEDLGNFGFQMWFQVSVVQSSNRNFSNLRYIDLSRTVNNHSQVRFHLAPYFDLKLVARPNNVIRRNLHEIDRRKCAWRLKEKRLSKKWQ